MRVAMLQLVVLSPCSCILVFVMSTGKVTDSATLAAIPVSANRSNTDVRVSMITCPLVRVHDGNQPWKVSSPSQKGIEMSTRNDRILLWQHRRRFFVQDSHQGQPTSEEFDTSWKVSVRQRRSANAT
mmetsp:Transcript_7484/g.45984  ORF Transcript_7484/g.45984 Transcript_7484/m.45984 type:complete len:127 (+) Transcript_7484:1441-1821(+)